MSSWLIGGVYTPPVVSAWIVDVMIGAIVDVAAAAALADALAQSGNSASSGYTTIPQLKITQR